MRFTFNEKRDLFYAGLMISLAFAILLSGGFKGLSGFSYGFLLIFFIAFFTAGTGFLLHELMHKYVAQRYGLRAEFKAFYPMLWLALVFSLFGFIFAAPGAVFISGFINKERNGKISLAGPMTNIVIAAFFAVALFLLGSISNPIVLGIFKFGLSINALLAAFNMIPVMPFDGYKILVWNKSVYTITVVVSLGLFFLSWFI